MIEVQFEYDGKWFKVDINLDPPAFLLIPLNPGFGLAPAEWSETFPPSVTLGAMGHIAIEPGTHLDAIAKAYNAVIATEIKFH